MGESTQANSSSGLILHWLNSLESKATVVVHVAVSCFRQDKNPARMKAVLVTAITQLSLSAQVCNPDNLHFVINKLLNKKLITAMKRGKINSTVAL